MMFWLISVHFNRPIIHFVQDKNTVDKKISWTDENSIYMVEIYFPRHVLYFEKME